MKNKKKLCFGVIIGTRAYFNSALAKDVRKQLLKTIEEQGYDYVILPEDATPTGSSSIETREDGIKCAELFRQNRDKIDGIIVSLPNFGFEIKLIWIAVVMPFVEKFLYAIIYINMAYHLQILLYIHILSIQTYWQKI